MGSEQFGDLDLILSRCCHASGSSFEQLNAKITQFALVALKGPIETVKLGASKQVTRGWLPASVLEMPDQELREQVPG